MVRHAKGGKQRRVPLPLQARRALQAYLDSRPPFASTSVFLGERGPLTTRGVRSLFTKYSAIVGVHIHPHALRHSYAKEFLAANANDLVGLASLMGHENLNTTRRYVQRTSEELHAASENLTF
jgi:integrase/recombinase XerC